MYTGHVPQIIFGGHPQKHITQCLDAGKISVGISWKKQTKSKSISRPERPTHHRSCDFAWLLRHMGVCLPGPWRWVEPQLATTTEGVRDLIAPSRTTCFFCWAWWDSPSLWCKPLPIPDPTKVCTSDVETAWGLLPSPIVRVANTAAPMPQYIRQLNQLIDAKTNLFLSIRHWAFPISTRWNL